MFLFAFLRHLLQFSSRKFCFSRKTNVYHLYGITAGICLLFTPPTSQLYSAHSSYCHFTVSIPLSVTNSPYQARACHQPARQQHTLLKNIVQTLYKHCIHTVKSTVKKLLITLWKHFENTVKITVKNTVKHF